MNTIKATSLKGIAVVGAAAFALTGCSSDSKKDASDATSKVTSAASTAASSATGASASASSPTSSSTSSPTASSTSPSVASSPTPSDSASSGASSASGSAASAPAGMQTVTAPVGKVSFAVPKDWTVITDATAKDPAVLKKLEPMAKHQGVAAEKLTQLYTSIADAVALDTDPAHVKNAANLNVLKMTTPELLTKEQFTKDFRGAAAVKFKPTLGEYSTFDTTAGKGAQMEYSVTANGASLHGVSMEIPNGTGNYARVTVSAPTAAEAEKIAKDVASSAHKL